MLICFVLNCTQGVLLLQSHITPEGSEGSQKIVRLWIHEVYRVFYDRLVDVQDQTLFFSMVKVGETKRNVFSIRLFKITSVKMTFLFKITNNRIILAKNSLFK